MEKIVRFDLDISIKNNRLKYYKLDSDEIEMKKAAKPNVAENRRIYRLEKDVEFVTNDINEFRKRKKIYREQGLIKEDRSSRELQKQADEIINSIRERRKAAKEGIELPKVEIEHKKKEPRTLEQIIEIIDKEKASKSRYLYGFTF